MKIIEGNTTACYARIVIIVARFNYFINKNLLDGAVDTLTRIGQIQDQNITIVWVPGAYELILTANILAKSKKYNSILVLGTIIRGDTTHYKFIAKECSSNLTLISMNELIPISFGILTTENIEQAIERAGSKNGNKGTEAALTALEMINVLQNINSNDI